MSLAALADDFYFETFDGAGHGRGHIAQRERTVDAMAEGAGGDPAHRLAVVPDRFVADGVGVGGIDGEGRQPQGPAAVFLRHRRRAADEFAFVQIDEPVEPGFEGAVDGAELARPTAEALLYAHGIERAAAE